MKIVLKINIRPVLVELYAGEGERKGACREERRKVRD